MRTRDGEIGDRRFPFGGLVKDLTRIGERVPCAVPRRRVCVADATNGRLCPVEKLLPVTIQARFVFRILRYIRKRVFR